MRKSIFKMLLKWQIFIPSKGIADIHFMDAVAKSLVIQVLYGDIME